MYDFDGKLKERWGLTDHEILWDRVAHSRMEEVVKNAETIKAMESENSFGEFLFIALEVPGHRIRFYGYGTFDATGEYIDYWKYIDNDSNMMIPSSGDIVTWQELDKLSAERMESAEIWDDDYDHDLAMVRELIGDDDAFITGLRDGEFDGLFE